MTPPNGGNLCLILALSFHPKELLKLFSKISCRVFRVNCNWIIRGIERSTLASSGSEDSLMETIRPQRIMPTRYGGKLRMVRILGPASQVPGSWLVLDVSTGETMVAPSSALQPRQGADGTPTMGPANSTSR